MNQEMLRIIDSIARDRNVDKEALYKDIEQAMVSAARKHFNAIDTEEFSCELDRLTGAITILHNGEEIPLESLGRIPAQTAKQVMIQKFREDERASIFDEFSDRIGEVLSGSALRYEGGNLIVGLGRAEGVMPRGEQIPGEQHRAGERVRCMILNVKDTGNAVKIILTRSHPEFIRRLFEVEVPEVAERVIEIKALSREPGHRSKVAVGSIDSKVDAVGACVGVRGSRIKNIVDELGGEKIDIVRWNESSQVLIANALRPAQVVEISLCFELGRATVVVNDDQLSLAIGKRGQNVRLAARLTGWDIDILTPPEFAKGLDIMEDTLKKVEGVNDEMLDRLGALGLISVMDIEEVGEEVLVDHLGEMGMTEEMADQCVELAIIKSQELALEQDAKEKAPKPAESNEGADDATADQVDAILGLTGAENAETGEAPAEEVSMEGDIVDMLLQSHEDEAVEEVSEAEPADEAGEVSTETVVDEETGEVEETETVVSEQEVSASDDAESPEKG